MGTEEIQVTGRGTVETVFDSVRYTVRVSTFAATGAAAKDVANPIIDRVRACLFTSGREAGLNLEMIRSKFDVDHVRKSSFEPESGYRATYEAIFEGDIVAGATRLHDQLTSIVGVESPTPNFLVRDLSAHENAAFKKAVACALAKFSAQCEALALNAREYEPVTWYVERSQGGGKTMALSAPETAAKPVGLEPGLALVEQVVTVTFARKDRARPARTSA